MGITFQEFVKQKALADKVPFDIDFEITLPGSDGRVESVGGYDITVYDELLNREVWFFELLEEVNRGNTGELTLVLRGLARKLKDLCDLPNLTEAIDILMGSAPAIEDEDALTNEDEATLARIEAVKVSQEYEDFCIEHEAELTKCIDLFRISLDTRTLQWMRITFFMLSRCRPTWTMGHTVALRPSISSKILNLMTKEANGGVMPPENEFTDTNEGKEAPEKPKSETGNKSTGK